MLLFGEMKLRGPDRYEVPFQLNNASGIVPGSPVTLNGVAVGEIRSTSTGANPREGVMVIAMIDRGVQIPRRPEITVDQSFVGETTLSLTPHTLGPDEPDPGVFIEGGEPIRASAEGMIERIAGLLEDKLAPFSSAAGSVQELAQTYNEVGKKLTHLLTPPEEGGMSVEDGNVYATLRDLRFAVERANTWLGDEELRGSMGETFTKAGETMEQIRSAAEEFELAATEMRTEVARAGDGFAEGVGATKASAAELNRALVSMQDLLAQVREGQGSLGLLVTNPDLYRSMNDAAVRLEQALREIQLLAEKYRNEGLPIGF
jgi:phospholipid/cholesterol/gamma-HCH transport system substrate-binding protein